MTDIEKDTKIYVITHKDVEIPQIPSYTSLLVGASLHETDGNFNVKDNDGISISEKNPSFCELTGVFWIWKNSQADYVGVTHYRRFFSTMPVIGKQAYFIRRERIEKLLDKYDIILPTPKYYQESALQAINYAPNINDVKEMYKAIKLLAPDYIEDFYWYYRRCLCGIKR